jgi:6-phosphogluconolactonase
MAFHPVTNQKRITITGRVINNAELVVFLVTGKKKDEIVEKIVKQKPSAQNFPASYIVPVYGRLSWFLDHDAGILL